MSRILVVEDNEDLAEGLRYNLELEGHEVVVAEDGHRGLDLARERAQDLIILDLMLPGVDGFQILKTIRAEGDRTPVLILSARSEKEDRIRGFRMDADQYLTKPFSLLELLERASSLLRRIGRGGNGTPGGPIRFGDIEVDPEAHVVTRAGEDVSLTPKGYDLMMALIRRDGAVASRQELLKEVWGHRGRVMTRTVDTHMAEIRKKLEDDPSDPDHFLTVWKVGYRFEA